MYVTELTVSRGELFICKLSVWHFKRHDHFKVDKIKIHNIHLRNCDQLSLGGHDAKLSV